MHRGLLLAELIDKPERAEALSVGLNSIMFLPHFLGGGESGAILHRSYEIFLGGSRINFRPVQDLDKKVNRTDLINYETFISPIY